VCRAVLDDLGLEKQINTSKSVNAQTVDLLDPVSELQLYCAKRMWPQPEFEFQEYGEPHMKQFVWKVSLNGVDYVQPVPSTTKKEGKETVCRMVLQALGLDQLPPAEKDYVSSDQITCPVTVLRRHCNKNEWPHPDFECSEHGPDHQKRFIFKATFNGVVYQPDAPAMKKLKAKSDVCALILDRLGLDKTITREPGEEPSAEENGHLTEKVVTMDLTDAPTTSTSSASAHYIAPVKEPLPLVVAGRNPVSVVMEMCSKAGWPNPEFVCDDSGQLGDCRFRWRATINGINYTGEPRKTKKEGKVAVCEQILRKLGLL